jgi:hypothetical protein
VKRNLFPRDNQRVREGETPVPARLAHRVPGSVPAGDPPYTFVTDGIEAAVGRAREMAGGRECT